MNLGNVFDELGKRDDAKRVVTRAIAILERTDPRHARLGGALATLGKLELEAASWTTARELLDRAVALDTAQGEVPALLPALTTRSQLQLARGDLAAARVDIMRALAIATPLGDSQDLGLALAALGNLEQAERHIDLARAAYERARGTLERSVGTKSADYLHVDATLRTLR
jgi:tetratricopeptide (TPR) repeat protein